jgi:hypothetical protein
LTVKRHGRKIGEGKPSIGPKAALRQYLSFMARPSPDINYFTGMVILDT